MDRKQCCVKLSVQPSRGLVDEKFVILVESAPPGFQLTVHALHKCEDGHSWDAFGHYVTNTTGTVNVSEDPSLGAGPFPGVLDLWGGGGKLVEYRAALLASHGFASLALEYMTPKILAENDKMVDDQYFEIAYKILEQHPQVLGSRIAVVGLSMGTSITLRMAVYSKVMKFRCLVCISGSHVQPIGGPWHEMMLSFESNAEKTRFDEHNQVIWRDLVLPIPTDNETKVDVGRLKCPLLLVVGEDDQNWAAYESALDMKDMMERAGNGYLLTILSYPKTGHLIEPPYTPHFRASIFKSFHTREKVMILWGGETAEHSRAQEDAWRKMLVFLRENLYGGANPGTTSLSRL